MKNIFLIISTILILNACSAKLDEPSVESKYNIYISKLSDEEIQQMVDEAKNNEESDKLKLRIIESRNKLDTLVYQTSKMMEENSDKIPADLTSKLEDSIGSAKAALDADDADALDTAHKNLEGLLHEAAQRMYEHQPAGEAAGPTPTDDADDVVDADFDEVQE